MRELGRLLEFARGGEAIEHGVSRAGDKGDGPLSIAALAGWDRGKVETQRFSRVMVSRSAKVLV